MVSNATRKARRAEQQKIKAAREAAARADAEAYADMLRNISEAGTANYEAEAAAKADADYLRECLEKRMRRRLCEALPFGDVFDTFADSDVATKSDKLNVVNKFTGQYFNFGGAGIDVDDEPEETSRKKAVGGHRRKVAMAKKLPAQPVPTKSDPEEIRRLAKAADKDGFAFGVTTPNPTWSLTVPSTSSTEKAAVTLNEV